jgi:uncharacterized protein (DUF2141 family)
MGRLKKKTMIHLLRILIILLVTTMAQAQTGSGTIELKILQIDNANGQMRIGIYDSEDSWLKKPMKGVSSKITDGKCEMNFTNMADGTYAISVYHDEDNDGELDAILGIPTEDTGSSNDAPARFGPPKWVDAKFEVTGGIVKQIINL